MLSRVELVEKMSSKKATDPWQEGQEFPRVAETIAAAWLGMSQPLPDCLAWVLVKNLYSSARHLQHQMRDTIVHWNSLTSRRAKPPTPNQRGEFMSGIIGTYMQSQQIRDALFLDLQTQLITAIDEVNKQDLSSREVQEAMGKWCQQGDGKLGWLLV